VGYPKMLEVATREKFFRQLVSGEDVSASRSRRDSLQGYLLRRLFRQQRMNRYYGYNFTIKKYDEKKEIS